jgi:hypothetical protein
MKPCSHNRKLIAWLAADALNETSAQQLRTHLGECEGCRQHWEQLSAICDDHKNAAKVMRGALPSPGFHGRLAKRLRTETVTRPIALHGLQVLFGPAMHGRSALLAAAAVLAIALTFLGLMGNRDVSRKKNDAAKVSQGASAVSADSRPTLSLYRTAMNSSFDALDDVLEQHAFRARGSNEPQLKVASVSTSAMAE